ncbi:hypothetical protein BKA62DRAFT_687338 [Auriculariales sp. MPI-PUGE-AT-0066]|nr:hypothetical protein BKA62DRAFT_687338 [Auriculariales sp. MPI-PUGE-AT-0066]
MANPTNVVVQVHTELQYDYDVPQALIASASGIASTMDNSALQNVYYIHGANVFNAYETATATGVESPAWVIEDMLFPTTNGNPTILRVVTQPISGNDTILVSTSTNVFYILQTGTRYLQWTLYTNPTGISIVDFKPAFDVNGNLQVSAAMLSSGSNHLMYTINLATNNWTVDHGVQAFTTSVNDFALSSAYASSLDNSQYGYLISSPTAIAAVTAATKFNAVRKVYSGNFSQLSPVELPYANAMPLVFAIETQTQLGAYFQVLSDGTFQRVALFGSTKLQAMTACLRIASDPAVTMDAGGNLVSPPSVSVEVFALDIYGNILHVESSMNQDPILTFTDTYASYYAITGWKDSISIASQKSGITVTVTPDGVGIVIAVGQDNSLQVWQQDPATTDWTSENLAIPDGSGATQVVQKTVYYCEVSLYDTAMVPVAGGTATVNSIQYTNLNINGRASTVDPVRSAVMNTNGLGKLCFTYDSPDSLAAPTLSLWLEGMASADRIDIAPSGDIQAKFKSITSDDLKTATNQVTGQPVMNVDDPTREAVADALHQVMNVFDPDDPNAPPTTLSAVAPEAADDASEASSCSGCSGCAACAVLAIPSRRYLHHKTPSHRALTRKRTERSLGHIRGQVAKGGHIEFRHSLSKPKDGVLPPLVKTTRLTSDEAAKQIQKLRVQGWPSLNFSWGDLWKSIKDGVYDLASYTFNSIKNGVESFITLIKDGVTYAWNGISNFVRQAFDVVGGIFEKIKVFFQDLFDWLAFLLDWGAMKNTAETFKTYITGFQQEGTDWLTNVVPQATDTFFKSLKSGLGAAIDAAKVNMGTTTLAAYDSTSPNANLLGDGGGSKQSLLDDLPSTAMWLLNKILNAFGGDNTYSFVSATLTNIQNFFSKFAQAATTAGLRDDFNNACNDFIALFVSLVDRSAADGTAWNHFIDLMKDAVFVVIDIIETLVLVFEQLAAEAFKFFFELFNAPVELPIVSLIFKKVTGTDLSIINSVCYSLAVPFTIIFKIITGRTPFAQSNPLLHKSAQLRALTTQDDLLISRGVLWLLMAPIDAIADGVGVAADYGKLPDDTKIPGLSKVAGYFPSPGRFINGLTLIVPLLNAAMSYDMLSDKDNAMHITTWSCSAAVPVLVMSWLVVTGFKEGPRGSVLGQTCFGIIGLSQLGAAIWHSEKPNTNPVTAKETDQINAQYFGFLGPVCKPLRAISQRVKNPYAVAAVGASMVVIDLVGNIGLGSCLISAGSRGT